MLTLSEASALITRIAEIGKVYSSSPLLSEIEPFAHYFSGGEIDKDRLDSRDGSCTRREILVRFLILCAVIDQGPDIIGIRNLLIDVTNNLYRQEVRFLHSPIEFFKEIGISIDSILHSHASVKAIRSEIWAKENQSSANKYNLFMDNSHQVLNYAIFRWGVPLSLPMLLSFDAKDDDEVKARSLISHLMKYDSAEIMSRNLKDHERYGLGKAIGDKAAHLFTKWLVTSFKLATNSGSSWSDLSYEVPYDSNAGRVLWRTGYLLTWAELKEYKKSLVVQPGAGKGGSNYIRVTNIRGMKTSTPMPVHYKAIYDILSTMYLMTHKNNPRSVEIQRIQHIFLLENSGKNYSVANFDDGLIYIGTNYCFNHAEPLCDRCPLKLLCKGHQTENSLILDYRT